MTQEPKDRQPDHPQPSWLQRQWNKLSALSWRDVIIAQVGDGSKNIAVGKYIFQVNVGGRNLAIPLVWIAIALAVIVAVLTYPVVEPILFPGKMTGGFKIAVAEFGELDAQGNVQSSSFGSMLSHSVYDQLVGEYEEHYPDLLGDNAVSVQVWHDGLDRDEKNVRFSVIHGKTTGERAKNAQELAERINADLVIYGNVTVNDPEDLTLEFYYNSPTLRGEPDTVSGHHLLGRPIHLPLSYQKEPMLAIQWLNRPLGYRTRALFWVTVALTSDVLDERDQALAILQEAERQLQDWDESDGKEVLYYFIGRQAFGVREYDTAITAYNKAYELNPSYAYALQGLGAVYYDRAQLFFLPVELPPEVAQCAPTEDRSKASPTREAALADIELAIDYLHQSIDVAPQAPWPPVKHIAEYTLGLAYRLKGQAYLQVDDYAKAAPLFTNAQQQFDAVLQPFTEAKQTQYIGWTYLGMAATDQMQAILQFNQAGLLNDPVQAQQERQSSIPLLQQAVDNYQRCQNEAKEVSSIVFQKYVVTCGCSYYQKQAEAFKTQAEALIKEQ